MIEQHNPNLEEALKALILEHETKLHSGYGGDLLGQLKHVIREYERDAVSALEDSQRFQRDMDTWLQALAICAQMVSNGATHAEKDARMRGMIEIIESARGKVKTYDSRLDRWNRRSYRHEDLFTNDYPVRHYKERADNAERELEELKKKLIEKPQEGDVS